MRILVLSVLRTRQFALGVFLVSVVGSIFLSVHQMGILTAQRAAEAMTGILGQGAGESFADAVRSSVDSLLSLWSLLGIVSFVAAEGIWAWWLADSLRGEFDKAREQGVSGRGTMAAVCASVALAAAPVWGLSMALSTFEQSASIGLTDYSLGGSFLYSTLPSASLAALYALAGAAFGVLVILARRPGVSRARGRVRPASVGTLGLSPFSGRLLVLCLAVVALVFAAGLPYLVTVSYAGDLGHYYSAPRGEVILPGSPVYISGSLTLPAAVRNCTTYSAELAFPAEAGPLNTVVRGVSPQNSTAFTGASLVSGTWPTGAGEVALGSQISAQLGLGAGERLSVTDLLNGRAMSVQVSGVYTSGDAATNQEIITDLAAARNVTGVAPGRYSYVRYEGCPWIAPSAESSLSIPQIAARLFSSSLNSSSLQGYSRFGGAQPAVSALASIGSVLVLGAAASLWVAAALYLKPFSGVAKTLYGQGVPVRRVRAVLSGRALPVLVLAAVCAGGAAYLSVGWMGVAGVFHYALGSPPPAYLALFVAVASVPSALAFLLFDFGRDEGA